MLTDQAPVSQQEATLNSPNFASCKMPEFSEKPPLSKAGKHPDFQVTSCHQNVSTNADFAYIESE